MEQITIIGVTGATAVLIQLLVLYVPGLNAWFAGLVSHVKALVFLGVDLIVAAFWLAFLFFKCFALAGIVCPLYEPATAVQIFLGLFGLFLMTLGIQQASYLVAPKPQAVRDAAAARPA